MKQFIVDAMTGELTETKFPILSLILKNYENKSYRNLWIYTKLQLFKVSLQMQVVSRCFSLTVNKTN
jgi:hypothetical protein